MPIRDVLLPRLSSQFAARKPVFATHPSPDVVFPAAHPEVGQICVWDDGDELTLAVGDLTHTHFNPYDPSLSEIELAERVSSDLLEFLEDVFADQVVFWQATDGRAGGGCVRRPDRVEPDGRHDVRRFLWSGPLAIDQP